MDSIAAIIEAFGGSSEFGGVCGFAKNPAARGNDMKQRGSIPQRYWPRLVDEAKRRDLPITTETLLKAHAGATEHAA
jgi:hypothetical protein